MTRKERVIRTIKRQDIDYLPSNIYFAKHKTKVALKDALKLASLDALDAFLENHIQIPAIMDDVFRHLGDHEYLRKASKTIFARIDWENGEMTDRWGIVYDINADGFCIARHPLRGASEEDIIRYTAPDPNVPGNYEDAKAELAKYGNEYFVFLSGYAGLFEKAWQLMGYEEVLTGMAAGDRSIDILLDKILEYKIEVAKKTIEMGFIVGHTSDDFGGQYATMISKDLWRKYYMPRYAKLWRVFKDAGLIVMHHSCGHITDFLGDFIDIGLDVIEPVQHVMDLKQLKREFGKHLTFWGGIGTQTVLPFGTPDDVRKETLSVMRTLGKNGGYIISPDQEVMADVPPANVVAYVETVREYRDKII
ncbi:MAG: uroporphyrinogen decarboxylase family protein [Spirochaetia bacterium]|jgi:uroporphyrinogen decarboxylase